MYKDTITLFNRKRSPHGDTWYAHVLHGVNLNTDKGAIIQKYGEQASDNAVLNVRYTKDGDKIKIGEYEWKPPKEWQTNQDGVTFTGGTAFDFFWMGAWTGSAVISDDNYGDLTFYDYMLGHYDYVFAVNNVAILTVIPHFEVTGR